MRQMLETKNLLSYFIIDWVLQPVKGYQPLLLDILARVMFYSLESMCEQYPVLKLNDLLARTANVADS